MSAPALAEVEAQAVQIADDPETIDVNEALADLWARAARAYAAERDELLARLRDAPKPTYRLPHWLGGHEVERIEEGATGGPIEVAMWRLVGGRYGGLVVAVRKDDVIEVPS